MTVQYTHEVATGKGFGNFGRLLFRWKGSIYKLVLPDLILYMFIYACISLGYRVLIKDNLNYQMAFEKLVKYCADYAGVIPVSFVLGFYVSQIVTRWWNQFMTIPSPDNIALIVATGIHGHDDRARLLRRTLMRYVNLSFVMTMIMISTQAKTRFPTIDHLVEAGIMMAHEKKILEELDKITDLPKYFIPIVWAGTLAGNARKEGRIVDDMTLVHLITNLTKWRTCLNDLLGYDWVCIPIVYTQVTTLAVYLYFGAALLGKQFIEKENELDLFVPIFLFLEFFFYMGWLKVAETMVNPFGEDDDDFEINWIIDRNFCVSYLIVDEMHSEVPELVKDPYWDEVIPEDLPYTAAAAKFKIDAPQGSTANSESAGKAEFIMEDKKVSNYTIGQTEESTTKYPQTKERFSNPNVFDGYEGNLEDPCRRGRAYKSSYGHLLEGGGGGVKRALEAQEVSSSSKKNLGKEGGKPIIWEKGKKEIDKLEYEKVELKPKLEEKRHSIEKDNSKHNLLNEDPHKTNKHQ